MKLKAKDDTDTVVVWAKDEKEHKEKLAYLKKHHNTKRDFILHNNEHGVRYTHNGEEWIEHSKAENPLEQSDEEKAAAAAEVERQKAAAEENAAELARRAEIQKKLDEVEQLQEQYGTVGNMAPVPCAICESTDEVCPCEAENSPSVQAESDEHAPAESVPSESHADTEPPQPSEQA